MKSHELARYLLQRPDSEVVIETAAGRDSVKIVSKSYRSLVKSSENCLVLIQAEEISTD